MQISKSSGFTLVELMVTTAVIAIIAMVVVPTYQGWRERVRLRGAAENTYSMIQYARSEGVKQNCDRMNVDITEGENWSIQLSVPAGSTCVPPDFLVSSVDYPDTELDSNVATLWFEGGRGISNGGTLQFTGPDNAANVVISLRGRVTLCGNFGGMPAC